MERDRAKLAKILKVSQLLARPRGFEPLTLGLEMRGIGQECKFNKIHFPIIVAEMIKIRSKLIS